MQGSHQERGRHRCPTGHLFLLIPAIFFAVAAGLVRAVGAQSSEGRSDDALVVVNSRLGDLRYTPGRGLRLGRTGFTIGGYSNVNLSRQEGQPAQLKFDDLSFFVSWDPIPRLHLFSELEFEDLLFIDEHGHGGTVDNLFTAERLYGDVSFADALNMRVGKFLTPVGRWNVIHAQPLVWTTSRPLATVLPFDPHTTGAMLFGSVFPGKGWLSYSLYGQFTDQFEQVVEPQPADRSAGGRLEYSRDDWSAGTSYLAFSHAGNWRHLGGIDGLWQHDPMEVMTEWVVEPAAGSRGTEWGFYVQGVYQVYPHWYLVGRYEHFVAGAQQRAVNLIDPGIAYKPLPYVVIKAEYLFADRHSTESPPGFASSVALLF